MLSAYNTNSAGHKTLMMHEKRPAEHPLYQAGAPDASPRQAPPPAKKQPRPPLREQPLLTYGLMALNTLIFLAGFLSPALEWELFLQGALIPQLVVEQTQVYRLLTAMFLHASLGHVFFNVYALYIIGRSVEPIFGRARFLLIYLLGGLTGSALSLLFSGLQGASVGASGAVFAIFAAEAVHLYQQRHFYRQVRRRLRHMGFLIALNLIIGIMPGARIDMWGHIGGLLGGALLAWRIAPRFHRLILPPPRSLRELARTDINPLAHHLPGLALYCFGLVGLVALAFVLLAP